MAQGRGFVGNIGFSATADIGCKAAFCTGRGSQHSSIVVLMKELFQNLGFHSITIQTAPALLPLDITGGFNDCFPLVPDVAVWRCAVIQVSVTAG